MSDTLVEQVRADRGTELDRLGSEKALLALTGADLETEPVLSAVGAALAAARDTLSAWADTEGEVGAALADAEARLEDASERLAAELEAELPAESDFLSLEGTTPDERAGAGLVGAGLVLDRFLLQAVSFFVNEADESRADLCRDLREMAADIAAVGGELDLDAAAATAAACGVVDHAYDTYVARLEAMGFDPKPIC